VKPEQRELLRVRAARNGRSIESELRHILEEALAQESRAEISLAEISLAESIRRCFEPLGFIYDLPSHP
jgi:plasmid stability protein